MTDPRNCRSSSWMVRHAAIAYLLLSIGIVVAFVVSNTLFTRAIAHTDRKARESCEAGNQRSQIQAEDIQATLAQVQRLDFERLFGIDAETAAEFRRLSVESNTRRLVRLPFLDCDTGMPAPSPYSDSAGD